jgi:RNA polymerase sigma-70 factor, ECF subfamily
MLAPRCTFRDDVVAAMPSLRLFALSLCRNPDRADDLVQDTVVAALTHQETFMPGSNLDAWLFVILRNKFRSRHRKGRREVEDPDEAMAKAVPFEDSPLRKMEVAEMLDFIERLPPVWRIPLKMIADGATYEEIAAETNQTIGTIKSRVNRGRTLLKDAD